MGTLAPSLSVGHINVSLYTLGRGMSVIDSREMRPMWWDADIDSSARRAKWIAT